jgi:hypothetical protein
VDHVFPDVPVRQWRTLAGMTTLPSSRATPAPSPSADRTRRSGTESRYALTVMSRGYSTGCPLEAPARRTTAVPPWSSLITTLAGSRRFWGVILGAG